MSTSSAPFDMGQLGPEFERPRNVTGIGARRDDEDLKNDEHCCLLLVAEEATKDSSGRSEVIFAKHHAREPGGVERVETGLYCQHHGKSLSVDHWEETCEYYMRHFPFDTYGRKWRDSQRSGNPHPI
jgi:hypothetical protein